MVISGRRARVDGLSVNRKLKTARHVSHVERQAFELCIGIGTTLTRYYDGYDHGCGTLACHDRQTAAPFDRSAQTRRVQGMPRAS